VPSLPTFAIYAAAAGRPHRAVSVGVTDLLRPFVWVGMNTIFIYLMSPSGGLWQAFDG